VNRFNYGGDNANLNYLRELLNEHDVQTTQYIFGGDAWDFGHTNKKCAEEQFSSLHAIKKLQDITWHVLGNRDLNKLFIPFWLVLLKDEEQVKDNQNFAGIWDTDYTALQESPNTLQDAIDHILQEMQGVKGRINGFANYDGQMPDLPYDESTSPSLYTYIVNSLYNEKHDTQSALFLRHLMYEKGVMYEWIKSGHIVLDFEWKDQQFVVSHGCLPTKENIEYYDTLHTEGFEQYKTEIKSNIWESADIILCCNTCKYFVENSANALNNSSKVTICKLAELTALSFSNNDSKSPVNSSCIGDQSKITQNVKDFRKKNKIEKQKKLVVLHGHRNYSIDTALKYDIGDNTTVLYYDTSAWRRKSKRPTSLWGKSDETLVYVDSAILEKPTTLSNYSTAYDLKENTFMLMGQAYKRKKDICPFIRGTPLLIPHKCKVKINSEDAAPTTLKLWKNPFCATVNDQYGVVTNYESNNNNNRTFNVTDNYRIEIQDMDMKKKFQNTLDECYNSSVGGKKSVGLAGGRKHRKRTTTTPHRHRQNVRRSQNSFHATRHTRRLRSNSQRRRRIVHSRVGRKLRRLGGVEDKDWNKLCKSITSSLKSRCSELLLSSYPPHVWKHIVYPPHDGGGTQCVEGMLKKLENARTKLTDDEAELWKKWAILTMENHIDEKNHIDENIKQSFLDTIQQIRNTVTNAVESFDDVNTFFNEDLKHKFKTEVIKWPNGYEWFDWVNSINPPPT